MASARLLSLTEYLSLCFPFDLYLILLYLQTSHFLSPYLSQFGRTLLPLSSAPLADLLLVSTRLALCTRTLV